MTDWACIELKIHTLVADYTATGGKKGFGIEVIFPRAYQPPYSKLEGVHDLEDLDGVFADIKKYLQEIMDEHNEVPEK